MKQWKQVVTGALVATAMLAGMGAGAMAEDTQQPAASQEQPKLSKEERAAKHAEHKLSKEFKAKLESAGVDLKGLRANRHELHQLRESIKTDAHALRDLVKNAPNQAELKAQVKADLAPHRDKIKALRNANKQARADFKAALAAQDVEKAKSAYQQIQSNQKQMKEALTALQSSIKSELAKLKG